VDAGLEFYSGNRFRTTTLPTYSFTKRVKRLYLGIGRLSNFRYAFGTIFCVGGNWSHFGTELVPFESFPADG
jgi:hypothetical protein